MMHYTAAASGHSAIGIFTGMEAMNHKRLRLFERAVHSRIMFGFYLLRKLPLGFVAGLRVERFDGEASVVSVPYGRITSNPFRSMYFAPMTMAAELASGLYALRGVLASEVPVSMLVIGMEARFLKKARSRVRFESRDGQAIANAIAACRQSNDGQEVVVHTSGFDAQGTEVARFTFHWTFRRKNIHSTQ
ncbi:MAG: DUF4442 domain-containing protein [Bacteroidetes bacterium]|nr:DUF4442 domain-containing protein [Bacteroidota bacterium]